MAKAKKKSLRGTPARGLRGNEAEYELRNEATSAIADAKNAAGLAKQKKCRAAVVYYGHAREAQGSAKALKAYVESPSKVATRLDDVAIAISAARKAFGDNCSCTSGVSGLKGRKKGR